MRTRVLGSIGALLTLAALAVLVRPDLLDSFSGVVSVVESQNPEHLLLALGVVVGAYATWSARARTGEQILDRGPAARFEGATDPPEAVSAADRTRTGASFDARIEAACTGDEEALDAVRSVLAETAASAYARAGDCEREAVCRAVATGAWTDDPVASAFLADDEGPNFSVLARLRAWLDPEVERRRRVERTVAAVGGVFDDGAGWQSETKLESRNANDEGSDVGDERSDATDEGGERR